ncbi:MAG: transcription elongation factor GreA [Gammaproteobacteria bacterium]|nr:transcription elongation factor GreA [Gammaproteobacteria bacterium]
MSKVPLTTQGADKLRTELQRLKAERPQIIEAIATAREHGDLKENAEYHAARDQQGLNEARIRDLEFKLGNAQIIDVAALNAEGRVVFGATVDLADVQSGDEVTYRIVGEDEADIKAGLLSISSPVARALIGKREGDVAVVRAPGGDREYEIVQVRYV